MGFFLSRLCRVCSTVQPFARSKKLSLAISQFSEKSWLICETRQHWRRTARHGTDWHGAARMIRGAICRSMGQQTCPIYIHIYDVYVDRDCQNNLQTSPYACRPLLKMKLTQNCCSINTFGRARSLTVPAHCAAPVVLLGGGDRRRFDQSGCLPWLVNTAARAAMEYSHSCVKRGCCARGSIVVWFQSENTAQINQKNVPSQQ